MTLTLWAVPGIGEISPGQDLAALVVAAADADGRPLRDGDVVAVASKVVAKAEGRAVPAERREQAIREQSVRLVAARSLPDGRVTRVVHAAAGPVMAAAGVDASDVAAGTVLLLPADADASARALRAALTAATGARVGVLVTDTSGRPWRAGVGDFALGAAGLRCLDDRRGEPDGSGRVLQVTVRAVADELAAAADLVKGKSAGTPVAVVRGLPPGTVTGEDGPGARDLTRSGATDWFRTGHVEAVWQALGADPAPPPIDPAAETVGERVHRAVQVALAPVRPDVRARVHPVPDHPAGDTGPVRVELTGDPFALGMAVARLRAAAWAEDLSVQDTAGAGTGGCRVLLTDTRPT